MHRQTAVVGAPTRRRGGSLTATRRGPDFGPPPDIFSGIPPDVMETLLVLAEIELARRERMVRVAALGERENRSPAQNTIAGTSKRPKTRKILDAVPTGRNDPVLQ